MPRIVFVLLLCWPTVVYADYLEVRRAATLRAEPGSGSVWERQPNIPIPQRVWHDSRRKPRVQYARAVTTCVAAICDTHRAIVLVSDAEISYGDASASALKLVGTHRDWWTMYAGDTSPCAKALNHLRKTLAPTVYDGNAITAEVEEAFRLNPCRKGEERWFIVSGFEGGRPRLFRLCDAMDNKGTPEGIYQTCDDIPGYSVIGSGEPMGRRILTLLQQHPTLSITETLYRTCAAKFFSEGARGVGEETYVYLLKAGEIIGPLPDMDPIKLAWKKDGQLPVPSSAMELIERALHKVSP